MRGCVAKGQARKLASVTWGQALMENRHGMLVDLRVTTTRTAKRVSWFEYWDVNPYNQEIADPGTRGVSRPTYDAKRRTLQVGQSGGRSDDTDPLSIFAAARSHSNSVGKRAPLQFANASASK